MDMFKLSIPYQVPGLFLTSFCHVIVIYHMLEQRFGKRKFSLYSCLYMASFVLMGGYAYTVGGIKGIITYLAVVVCLFLFFCIVSRECFSKKCFLFLTYFGLFSIIDNSLKLLMNLLLPQLSAVTEYYAAIILRTAALLLILALYKKYAASVIRSLADIAKGRWWNLAMIALTFYLLQATLSILNKWGTMSKLSLFLMFVAVSFVMCAVYGVVLSNIRYMKKDLEAALIRQNAEYLSAQMSALQNAEEAHRRLRHDMRHHLKAIAEYAKIGDVSGILAYIREYDIEISKTAIKQYSVNSTINMILSAYAGKAGESGVGFSVKCNASEKLAIRDIDLISLLGNLLENALHGCEESGKENSYANIHIRMQNNRLFIACNNTCPDNMELSGGLPVPKSIGISSILSVCENYNGSLAYSVENGVCSACVVLNL